MKKELPKYFAIKIEENNPLWIEYIDWLNKEYGQDFFGNDDDSYYGYDGKGVAHINIENFNNNPTILTLEEWNEIVNGKEEIKQEEFLPGDLVGVSDESQEVADRDFRDSANVWYVGKNREGLYVVENKYGYVTTRKFISKTSLKQETITITTDSGEKLEITKEKARELGFNIN